MTSMFDAGPAQAPDVLMAPPAAGGPPAILPDMPTPSMLSMDAMSVIVHFLMTHGPTRTGADISKERGTSRPLPTIQVDGAIHLALGQLAGHEALPFGGDVKALLHDIIHIGLGAYAQTILNYDKSDERAKLGIHIVRREEAMRRGLLEETLGVWHTSDLVTVGHLLSLAQEAGDRDAIVMQLERLFYYAEQITSRLLRHQFMRLMYGNPEIRKALGYLAEDMNYYLDPKVQDWIAVMDQMADQVEQRRRNGNG